MKTLILTITIFLTYSSLAADCPLYFHDNLSKENEKNLLFTTLSEELKNRSIVTTAFLDQARQALQVEVSPVLTNKEFLYQTHLKLKNVNGETQSETSRAKKLKDALLMAMEKLDFSCELY